VTTAANSVVSSITLTDSEVRFYKEEGYLPLPGFVRESAVAALRQEIYDILEVNGLSKSALSRATATADKLRQYPQYLINSNLDELINGEPTLAIASRLIGGPAHRYLPFTAVKAGGGGGTFHFHQDNNYTNHDPAIGSINIWVALVDMTPENGCLQIIPRSHLAGQAKSHNSDDGDVHQQIDVNPIDCLPLRMRPGDAVAFTRWTIPGSGPNHTSQPRLAYALQYHREDVKWRDGDMWKRILDTPRWSTPPVERLEAQKK
jgi:2-oxoglutarate-dependent dioxygenase